MLHREVRGSTAGAGQQSAALRHMPDQLRRLFLPTGGHPQPWEAALTASWYALRSQAHKESILHRQLLAKQIECFYPQVKVNPVNPRAAKWRPLFPNYMFVRTSLETQGVSVFSYLPFSQGLVELGGDPAQISDLLVREISLKVDSINAAGGLAYQEFERGTPIRVQDGPFRGYEGIFDMRLGSTDRVMILLNMTQKKKIRVKVHVGAIQKSR